MLGRNQQPGTKTLILTQSRRSTTANGFEPSGGGGCFLDLLERWSSSGSYSRPNKRISLSSFAQVVEDLAGVFAPGVLLFGQGAGGAA